MAITGKIPRKLHLIWVGDESKRPDRWIDTWRNNHPDWEFRLWGNAEYESVPWICKRQMELLRQARLWNGVADLMRYEILNEHGGVYADADSISLRPLDGWLLENRMFAVWESENHMPGQIANTYIGSVPGHPILSALIAEIYAMKNPASEWRWMQMKRRAIQPWRSVGPRLFTKTVNRFPAGYATILPSVMFLPRHFKDEKEREAEIIYARHEWGSTLNLY